MSEGESPASSESPADGLGFPDRTWPSSRPRWPPWGSTRAMPATTSTTSRPLSPWPRCTPPQFLLESVTIGLPGGLVGAAAGVLITVVVAVVRDWTPLLEPSLAAAGPLLGAVIGLTAGTYPAWKASAIEPITALRRG